MVLLDKCFRKKNYMNSEMGWDSIKGLSKQACSMHWHSIDCQIKRENAFEETSGKEKGTMNDHLRGDTSSVVWTKLCLVCGP